MGLRSTKQDKKTPNTSKCNWRRNRELRERLKKINIYFFEQQQLCHFVASSSDSKGRSCIVSIPHHLSSTSVGMWLWNKYFYQFGKNWILRGELYLKCLGNFVLLMICLNILLKYQLCACLVVANFKQRSQFFKCT